MYYWHNPYYFLCGCGDFKGHRCILVHLDSYDYLYRRRNIIPIVEKIKLVRYGLAVVTRRSTVLRKCKTEADRGAVASTRPGLTLPGGDDDLPVVVVRRQPFRPSRQLRNDYQVEAYLGLINKELRPVSGARRLRLFGHSQPQTSMPAEPLSHDG